LIQAGGNILYSEIQKPIKSILNKEEMIQQWKEPIYKNGHKNDCSNYIGILMLPTIY